MATYIEDFGTIEWYHKTFGLNSLGERAGHRVEDEAAEEEDDMIQDVRTEASSYTCLKPLTNFSQKLMRGAFEIGLCKLCNDSIAGKSLNLANQEETLKGILQDIGAKYSVDFPPKKETVGENRVTHDSGMEVIKTSALTDKADYEVELDKWLKACKENETSQIREFVMSRVAFVIDDLSDELPGKVLKQGLAREAKRKMCIYASEFFGMKELHELRSKEADNELQDKSLLIMTCKAKSSLEIIKGEVSKLTGAKKHTMSVATIDPNATDSLQRFKRGRRAFGSKVEDRFVACSVGAIASAHCGAMQFLEGGDTYFNKWPVRLIPVTDLRQMDEVAYEKLYDFGHC
eukprot:s410_g14.t1